MQGKQIKKWNNTPGHRQVDCARSNATIKTGKDDEKRNHDDRVQPHMSNAVAPKPPQGV